MDLINQTAASAGLFRTTIDEDRLLASVAVRTTYGLEDGSLRPADGALPGPVLPVEGEATSFGTFDDEGPFAREGTDVFVLGHAYPDPDGDGTRGHVRIRVEDQIDHAISVVGDRVWVRNGRQLNPSAPKPFSSIPLTWSRAFGGTCETPHGELPHLGNSEGLGYFERESDAEGGALPNLEDPQDPISTWNQRPEPRATAPLNRLSSIRIMAGTVMKPDEEPEEPPLATQALFNNAPPELVARPGVRPGMVVTVDGVMPGGRDLRFAIPNQEYHVHVQLAQRSYVFPSHLESVAIWSEEGRVVIGHRCTFEYAFHAHERRAAVLYAGGVPPDVPAEYALNWEELEGGGPA